jgi:ABC-type molybdenum transport system ATPase subunit/photorepair protein PhrA
MVLAEQMLKVVAMGNVFATRDGKAILATLWWRIRTYVLVVVIL